MELLTGDEQQNEGHSRPVAPGEKLRAGGTTTDKRMRMESRPQLVLRSPQQKREEAGRHPTTASAEGFHQEEKPLKGQKKRLRRLQRNTALADLSDERDMGMDQDGESRMKRNSG